MCFAETVVTLTVVQVGYLVVKKLAELYKGRGIMDGTWAKWGREGEDPAGDILQCPHSQRKATNNNHHKRTSTVQPPSSPPLPLSPESATTRWRKAAA